MNTAKPTRMVVTSPINTKVCPVLRLAIGFVLLGLLCLGCHQETSLKEPPHPEEIQKVEFNGFTIPVFKTGAKQLIYAKSRIESAREKEAALKFVLNRFSQESNICARARLDLAYLSLGEDFRQANRDRYRQALDHYRRITRTYADLPDICAKAYWYMGWIYTDLLGDKQSGLAMYHEVIDRYPSERMTIESSAHWINLGHLNQGYLNQVYPQRPEESIVTPDHQTPSWADLALLEVVKNEKNPIWRRQALLNLHSRKANGLTMGFALIDILKSGNFNIDKMVRGIAREYILHPLAHKVLARDIEKALAKHKTRN